MFLPLRLVSSTSLRTLSSAYPNLDDFKYRGGSFAPCSHFAEIEQVAFTPSHVVDGWAPSADPVLQARLFSYPGALLHFSRLFDALSFSMHNQMLTATAWA